MHVSLHVCVCTMSVGAPRPRHLDWRYRRLQVTLLVLGIELGPSGIAGSAFNC